MIFKAPSNLNRCIILWYLRIKCGRAATQLHSPGITGSVACFRILQSTWVPPGNESQQECSDALVITGPRLLQMNIKLCTRSKSSFSFHTKILKFPANMPCFPSLSYKVAVPPKVPIHWWCLTCYFCSPTSDQCWKETLPWIRFGSHTGQSAGAQFHAFFVPRTRWWLQPHPVSPAAVPRRSPLPAALSATPSPAQPQGPFYTPGAVTEPARGVASPRHCTSSQGPLCCLGTGTAAQVHLWVPWKAALSHASPHNWFQVSVQQRDAWIYVHILVVLDYFILDIIYIQIYAHT